MASRTPPGSPSIPVGGVASKQTSTSARKRPRDSIDSHAETSPDAVARARELQNQDEYQCSENLDEHVPEVNHMVDGAKAPYTQRMPPPPLPRVKTTAIDSDFDDSHSEASEGDRAHNGVDTANHAQSSDGDQAPTAPVDESLDDAVQQLPDFAWDDLNERYMARMAEKSQEVGKLYDEYEAMHRYMIVWMDIGQSMEVQCGSKRLKTQEFWVQNKERELEERRQHYIKVVAIFRQAFALLND